MNVETPAAGRFWTKVEKTSSCWIWTGAIDRTGYARFFHLGKNGLAHRISYELVAGAIPAGLELDHLCRVRHCVNPAHLEPVTRRENILRGDRAKPGWLTGRPRCSRGHLLSAMYCRACGEQVAA